jgi:hypothetical protein
MRSETSRALALLAGTVASLAACSGDDLQFKPPDATPTGTIALSWAIQDERGGTRTCLAAGVNTVEALVAGRPTDVDCARGALRLDGLLPDTYPVVANARGGAGTVRDTIATSVAVVAGSTTAVPLTFVVDNNTNGRGTIVARWSIEGRAAVQRCEAVGAANVRIRTAPGSVRDLDLVRPCVDGLFAMDGLETGIYQLELRLEAADGSRIASILDTSRTLRDGARLETDVLDFVVAARNPPRLRAEWTITGTPAATACPAINGRRVTFGLVPSAGAVDTSTTVDCRRGFAILSEGLAAGFVDLRLRLEHGAASVTTTTALMRLVPRTGTATVPFTLVPTE